VEVIGQLDAMAGLTPWKDPDIHWIGGWVNPRAGVDVLLLTVFEPLIMRTYTIQNITTVTPVCVDKKTCIACRVFNFITSSNLWLP